MAMETLAVIYYAISSLVYYFAIMKGFDLLAIPTYQAGIIALLLLPIAHTVIYVLYRYHFRTSRNFAQYESVFFNNDAKANKGKRVNAKRFKNMRKQLFPGPYPNCWYKVANVRDLRKDKPLSVSAFGQDMVIFLGEDGNIGVLHAYCPHLGAHLGKGGKVEQGKLVCPWHNWKFDAKGKCVDVPYAGDDTCAISSRLDTKAYEYEVVLGMVFVWFDAENRPPSWHVSLAGITEQKFYYGGTGVLELAMHISEAHENSADFYHFHTLHSVLPVPVLHRYFNLVHTTTVQYRNITHRFHEGKKMSPIEIQQDDDLALSQEPDRHDDLPHLTEFVNSVQMMFLNKWKVGPVQYTRVTFEGPSIMHFRIHTTFGEVHIVKTALPLAPFQQYMEDTWYAQHGMPRFFAHLIVYIAHWALEQDREIWENKMYVQNPILTRGDGPFALFRKWLSQFYSENSPNVLKQNCIDW